MFGTGGVPYVPLTVTVDQLRPIDQLTSRNLPCRYPTASVLLDLTDFGSTRMRWALADTSRLSRNLMTGVSVRWTCLVIL